MVNINWTDEAELWLKDIYDYIALDKKSIAKKSCNRKYMKKFKYFNLFQELVINMKMMNITRSEYYFMVTIELHI